MSIVLLPGRHVLNTSFQEQYLFSILRRPIAELAIWDGKGSQRPTEPLDTVVFAITSCNQSHSRYNPIPLEVRAIGVDRFARRLADALQVRYRIVPVPHYAPSPRFCQFVLKEINEATEGDLVLSPGNTLVCTSTPAIVRAFQSLGFGIIPGELTELDPERWHAPTPNEAIKTVVAAGENWPACPRVRGVLSGATFSVWRDFPDVMRRVLRLFRDPLLTDQGSLTEMRNYSTYARGMSDQAILELKYQDIRHAIVPGKIVDEGCADGALLVPIARDFPDSDLIGIEITGEFLARCHERQRAQEYAGTYIHFHQRNIAEPIFEPNSIDTTICNSTTHELWSYGQQANTVRAYLREKHRQTRPGGRLVIRDVVGPEDSGQEVYLWCNDADGAVSGPIETLSTAARFDRFACEYLRSAITAGRRRPEDAIHFRTEMIAGRTYRILSLKDAVEFMMKKDYTDNWDSELQEEFAFWSFTQWKQELQAAGWQIIEDAAHPERGSRVYRNEWIVTNRLVGKVALFRKSGDQLDPMDYPVTNMILVGRK